MAGNPRPDATPDARPAPSAGDADVPETEDESTSQARAEVDPEMERLTKDLEAARRRVDELARAYQAVDRDKEEFKQRLTRERERMMDVERGKVASTLLEALDELDRCLSMSAQDTSPLAQGVRMIRDALLAKVQGMGIERISVVGQPYDPNVAEAADMEITTSPEEDQQVVAELSAGYRLKDRVIRPARVKVARYVAPAQA